MKKGFSMFQIGILFLTVLIILLAYVLLFSEWGESIRGALGFAPTVIKLPFG